MKNSYQTPMCTVCAISVGNTLLAGSPVSTTWSDVRGQVTVFEGTVGYD